MKKIFFIFLISFVLFSSCGRSNETDANMIESSITLSNGDISTETEAKDYTAQYISDVICKSALFKEGMTTLSPTDEDYSEAFEYLFDFDLSLTSDSSIRYCTSGRLSDELDVFVLDDEIRRDEVIYALKARANSRAAAYRGYYDNESKKAENALILTNGKYVVFVISDENDAVEDAFKTLF